jgi:hypothetical protein
MAEQLPLPAPPESILPPLALSDGALLEFSREINVQLKAFDKRFATPRVHPRLTFGQARGPSRRPR